MVLIFEKLLKVIRQLICADSRDVLHYRQHQLYYYFAMKLFMTLQLLKGESNIRHMKHLILCRIIANMPAVLYQYAHKLVNTGQHVNAVHQLQRAVDRGHLPSRAFLAYMLTVGLKGIRIDRERAFVLVNTFHLDCHHCQGMMAVWHWIVQRDNDNYAHEYVMMLAQNSSKKGCRYGSYILGLFHEHGLKGVGKDLVKAFKFHQQAAKKGLDDAQYHLGNMYDNGFGVDKNTTKALKWFHRAACQKHSSALYNIGVYHEYGLCVPKNEDKALYWYVRAQEAGYFGIEIQFALRRLKAK